MLDRRVRTPTRGTTGDARGVVFAQRSGYVALSTRPLHILLFLLPLILFYELGSALFLSPQLKGAERGEAEQTIRAERLLSSFFEWFGVSGIYLPGIVLVVVLLVWHTLTRDRWQIRWSVLGGMLVEALAWTIPLLVLNKVVYVFFQGVPPMTGSLALAGTDLRGMSRPALITISFGAALYEELLFRLVLIAAVHLLAADLLRMRDAAAKVVAVVVSALAFTVYHDVVGPTGTIAWPYVATYMFAGLYFGTVYILRGFGIVVGVHALYDLAVLVVLRQA